MRFFAPGFAAAVAIVVTAGCSGGGMGTTTPPPLGGNLPSSTMSATRVTFPLSSSGPTTHALPSAGGFSGSVTLPATNAPAGTMITIDARTPGAGSVITPQAGQLQPLDVGGASVLFSLTFTSLVTFTLDGFPSFSVDIPQQADAAGQFFLALSAPPVAGVQAQFQTLGPAGVQGNALSFTGFTDKLTLTAGTAYTFALGAREQETRSPGLFFAPFIGLKRPALDPIEATGEFSAANNTLTFTALAAGPIATGQDNYFAWGIDRGNAAIAPFTGEPNVKFNALLVVEAQAEGGLNVSINLGKGLPFTQLPASDARIDGNKITVSIPATVLPSTGLQPSGMLWNLWTQDQLQAVTPHVAAFIPDNQMVPLLPGNEPTQP